MAKRKNLVLNPTGEQPIYPPHDQRSPHTRLIFTIFALSIILVVSLAIYVAFFTDVREKASRAIATETAAVHETAAAHSTQTAAAGGYAPIATGTIFATVAPTATSAP